MCENFGCVIFIDVIVECLCVYVVELCLGVCGGCSCECGNCLWNLFGSFYCGDMFVIWFQVVIEFVILGYVVWYVYVLVVQVYYWFDV